MNFDQYIFPRDIKYMSEKDLNDLAKDIRTFLVEKVSKTGGHLASNLGVVEITIALHRVFDSPRDRFVFDVGHQSYVHKILTGRADKFDTLRQFEGLSGFPKAKESKHDAFDTGHSSTSLSAAFGIAKARDIKGEDNQVIAVIGDGALTGGMAYEALNNIGSSKTNMIVILNDNGMSISKNTGSVSKHLVNLRTSDSYLASKTFFKKVQKSGGVGRAIAGSMKSIRDNLKYSMIEDGGVLFEELGFTYLGPVDGHNIKELITVLEKAKRLKEPVVIHAITVKGKGYPFAEIQPNKFHGIGPFDVSTGEVLKKSGISYSKVMGDYALKLADKDDSIVAITAAMGDATGLGDFAKKYPKRFFDVGIAEEHAVTFAAGLAKNGMKPLVAIYSSFLQRAYDQIMIDVCMQNLPVVFAIDRAGCVGADGETHHGIFDLSYLDTIPNLTVLAPKDKKQLEEAMEYAFSLGTPVAIRYPRGEADLSEEYYTPFTGENITYSIAKGDKESILIRAVGTMFNNAVSAAKILGEKGYTVDVENTLMHQKENNTKYHICVTIKDGLADDNDVIGWPKEFIQQGSVDQLMEKYGLDPVSISERILERL
ncbi:MAG: 1-deoxy-D-xylulose-5-phosphate synthase [Clostridia bacterium]|nr:1-deoxy-D-xylulose-5-phosphate synthase [Clostridia bacterium]